MKDKIVAESEELSYEANDTIDKLWGLLIEKAVICLRMFDEREPFLLSSCNNKYQYVYGMDKLKQYHDSYVDFEGILYGSDVYYRDHVFHAIRVWLLGIYLLLSDNAFIVGNGNTEKLIEARRAVLDLILSNHDRECLTRFILKAKMSVVLKDLLKR